MDKTWAAYGLKTVSRCNFTIQAPMCFSLHANIAHVNYACVQSLLELSQDQFQDLETLRQIYLARRGTLAMERKMLVHQAAKSISTVEETVPLPGNTRVGYISPQKQCLSSTTKPMCYTTKARQKLKCQLGWSGVCFSTVYSRL